MLETDHDFESAAVRQRSKQQLRKRNILIGLVSVIGSVIIMVLVIKLLSAGQRTGDAACTCDYENSTTSETNSTVFDFDDDIAEGLRSGCNGTVVCVVGEHQFFYTILFFSILAKILN
ncbi:hypothetical protein QYM36_003132 [Artemia franciscana]|uniref:Uncharacterized protein n=1 Tax=Artemia franciscana TaxID=6661 RepID=A0AA88LA50_ARTSF|nr:hypothetical protein QYM36_003132 [Artemia franciscana]